MAQADLQGNSDHNQLGKTGGNRQGLRQAENKKEPSF
jgi:hypothetical protein